MQVIEPIAIEHLGRSEKEERSEEYLLSLHPARQAEYKEVKFFTLAIGKIGHKKNIPLGFLGEKLHTPFLEYAALRSLGPRSLERDAKGKSHAVLVFLMNDIFLEDDGKRHIHPRSMYANYRKPLDEHPDHDKIMEAAEKVFHHFEQTKPL